MYYKSVGITRVCNFMKKAPFSEIHRLRELYINSTI